jgi:hypothetical protein
MHREAEKERPRVSSSKLDLMNVPTAARLTPTTLTMDVHGI